MGKCVATTRVSTCATHRTHGSGPPRCGVLVVGVRLDAEISAPRRLGPRPPFRLAASLSWRETQRLCSVRYSVASSRICTRVRRRLASTIPPSYSTMNIAKQRNISGVSKLYSGMSG